MQSLFPGTSNSDDVSAIEEPDPYENPYATTKGKSTPSPSKKNLVAYQDQLVPPRFLMKTVPSSTSFSS